MIDGGLMGVFDFEHQNEKELEDAISAKLTNEYKQLLSQVSYGQSKNESVRQCGKSICESLIEYCTYQNSFKGNVDPFDDPFVGAVLMTCDGRILGSHRKESRNEPHAEAATIINAIKKIDLPEKKQLIETIYKCYADRTWLQSNTAIDEFIKHFEDAGNLIRKYIESSSPNSKLIFISTLEPCRDFETQPSCAHIISAFKPDILFYGCDDTNSKGQGKDLMIERGINVVDNVAMDRNIEANKLFYSSIYYLRRLHSETLRNPWNFNIFYVVANLDRLIPGTEIVNDRLSIVFDDPVELPIHPAPIEPRAPNPQIGFLTQRIVDSQRVLFINQLDYRFIPQYFQQHLDKTNCIPGIIVCSQSKKNDSELGNLELELEKLKGVGVRIYTDVLRTIDEQYLALQSIRRWRSIGADNLYISVKCNEGYHPLTGNAEAVGEKLLDINLPRRVTIFGDDSSRNALIRLIRILERGKAFEKEHELSLASFRIILIAENEPNIEPDITEIKDFLRKEGLQMRFSVTPFLQEPYEKINAEGLRYDLMSGRLDPIALDTEHLDSMLDSLGWRDRHAVGLFLDAAARRDPILYRDLIAKKLPDHYNPNVWCRICSLLNAIAKFGIPHDSDRDFIFGKMNSLSKELNLALDDNPMPIILDVVWRFIAASLSISQTKDDIEFLIGDAKLTKYIGCNSFLLKELFFYASLSRETPDHAISHAFDILEKQLSEIDSESLKKILLRVTRHIVQWDPTIAKVAQDRIQKIFIEHDDIKSICEKEKSRCKFILGNGLSGVFSFGDDKYHTFASYLFIRTASIVDYGLLAATQIEISKVISSRLQHGEEPISWRGDKTTLARLALSEVSSIEVFKYLEAMATDEDDTIRWAALVLAMDIDIRRKLLPNNFTKGDCLKMRKTVASIIESVLQGNPHYWLEREFLSLFYKEHFEPNPLPEIARIQIIDVPSAKYLVNNVSKEIHPEVSDQLERLKKKMKKITLVLPPIERSTNRELPAIINSTPPLGLGSIASFLLSKGHDVELIDCHRFPELTNQLNDLAKERDLVGFSVVTSTFRTTEQLISEMKNVLGRKTPKIAIGGHAVSLHPREFIGHPTFQWDYLISGDGEFSILDILGRLNEETSSPIPGVIQRSLEFDKDSTLLPAVLNSADWDSLPWVDRRIFSDPKGNSYEPGHTRNRSFIEAHIVMSRGCAWKCQFCTEAIIRGNKGESRRSTKDILDEVEYLIKDKGVSRIQFVDDNLLPQIAAKGVHEDEALLWAESLINGITDLRKENPQLEWRGIFRFEDFLAYNNCEPQWIPRLKESGCLLLAFGVEHGLEERRKKLKGGSITNDQIKDIVKNLTEYDIATKGYFIIGGENEDRDSVNHSINFAISTGFTLAYFALYKNFRELVRRSKTKHGTIQEREDREKTFISFQNFLVDFDTRIRGCEKPQDCIEQFGLEYDQERINEAHEAIKTLSEIGFSFNELFKYNDFHAHLNEINNQVSVWKKENGNGIEIKFQQAVCRAYFEFYARMEFVNKYKWLIERGY